MRALSVTAGNTHEAFRRTHPVLISDTMVANAIRGALEQEGAIVAAGAYDASMHFDAMIVDGECSHRPVVKSLLDAGVRMIAYAGDAASFLKRFRYSGHLQALRRRHFVSAVELLLNTKPEEPKPLGE
jgi:hypothetical protein